MVDRVITLGGIGLGAEIIYHIYMCIYIYVFIHFKYHEV